MAGTHVFKVFHAKKMRYFVLYTDSGIRARNFIALGAKVCRFARSYVTSAHSPCPVTLSRVSQVIAHRHRIHSAAAFQAYVMFFLQTTRCFRRLRRKNTKNIPVSIHCAVSQAYDLYTYLNTIWCWVRQTAYFVVVTSISRSLAVLIAAGESMWQQPFLFCQSISATFYPGVWNFTVV
jgi:hypothetical protein